MLVAAAFLALSTCAVWLPSFRGPGGIAVPAWIVGLVATASAGFLSNLVDVRGLLAIATLCCFGLLAQHSTHALVRRTAVILAVGLAFALGIQQIPGFRDAVFVDGLRLSEDAAPMRLTLNLAPGAAGLVLLAIFCRRVQSLNEVRAIARPTLAVAGITTAVVMSLGLAVGYVRFDPKLPWVTGAYLLKTLLYTAVLEQAFFCGIVQEGLSRIKIIATRPFLGWFPILATSVLFGVAHARAGPTFVVLATVAGIGYSMAYALTRKVEASIAVHFTVNAVNFLAFTYPRFSTGV